jgi:hypothetical protein
VGKHNHVYKLEIYTQAPWTKCNKHTDVAHIFLPLPKDPYPNCTISQMEILPKLRPFEGPQR